MASQRELLATGFNRVQSEVIASEAGSEGQRPGFMPAQPNGLGNLEIKIMRAEGSIHGRWGGPSALMVLLFPIPSPLGWAAIKTGRWPSQPIQNSGEPFLNLEMASAY